MITIRELAVLAAVTLCGACNAYCETYSSAIPFDGVSAWVTGTRFACGANRDRPLSSPPPEATAVFAMPDGTTNSYVIAKVEWKGRHYVERLFTPEERKSLAGATFLGVRIENAALGDAGRTAKTPEHTIELGCARFRAPPVQCFRRIGYDNAEEVADSIAHGGCWRSCAGERRQHRTSDFDVGSRQNAPRTRKGQPSGAETGIGDVG